MFGLKRPLSITHPERGVYTHREDDTYRHEDDDDDVLDTALMTSVLMGEATSCFASDALSSFAGSSDFSSGSDFSGGGGDFGGGGSSSSW